MPIGSLVNTTPGAGDVAGTSGPAELKDIKTQIRASFPAFTTGNDVVTKTAGQINNAPDKTATETVTGSWTFSGTLNASGTVNFNAGGAVNLNGSTVVSGSWQFKSNPIVADGKKLRFQNPDNTASTGISRDGTSLNVEAVTGTTQNLRVFDGIALQVYDSSNTQYIGMSCNGVNAFLATNSGSIQVNSNGIFDIVGGAVFRIRDAGATDLADFQHNGTDFVTTFTNTGDWNITGVSNIRLGGAALAKVTDIANDKSYAYAEKYFGAETGPVTKTTLTSLTNAVTGGVTYNGGTGEITVPVTGAYRLSLDLLAQLTSGSSYVCILYFRRNGADLLSETHQLSAIDGVSTARQWIMSRVYSLTAGDVITFAYELGAGVVTTSSRYRLSVEKLS